MNMGIVFFRELYKKEATFITLFHVHGLESYY